MYSGGVLPGGQFVGAQIHNGLTREDAEANPNGVNLMRALEQWATDNLQYEPIPNPRADELKEVVKAALRSRSCKKPSLPDQAQCMYCEVHLKPQPQKRRKAAQQQQQDPTTVDNADVIGGDGDGDDGDDGDDNNKDGDDNNNDGDDDYDEDEALREALRLSVQLAPDACLAEYDHRTEIQLFVAMATRRMECATIRDLAQLAGLVNHSNNMAWVCRKCNAAKGVLWKKLLKQEVPAGFLDAGEAYFRSISDASAEPSPTVENFFGRGLTFADPEEHFANWSKYMFVNQLLTRGWQLTRWLRTLDRTNCYDPEKDIEWLGKFLPPHMRQGVGSADEFFDNMCVSGPDPDETRRDLRDMLGGDSVESWTQAVVRDVFHEASRHTPTTPIESSIGRIVMRDGEKKATVVDQVFGASRRKWISTIVPLEANNKRCLLFWCEGTLQVDQMRLEGGAIHFLQTPFVVTNRAEWQFLFDVARFDIVGYRKRLYESCPSLHSLGLMRQLHKAKGDHVFDLYPSYPVLPHAEAASGQQQQQQQPQQAQQPQHLAAAADDDTARVEQAMQDQAWARVQQRLRPCAAARPLAAQRRRNADDELVEETTWEESQRQEKELEVEKRNWKKIRQQHFEAQRQPQHNNGNNIHHGGGHRLGTGATNEQRRRPRSK